MPVKPSISFAKIAGIVTVIGSLYGIGASIYNSVEKNREAIQQQAIDRIIYRGEMARFKDSVRRALTRLEKKDKLEPTFSK
jgi:hypothetical protein